MILKTTGLGKKFVRDWVIRDFNYTFAGPGLYAVRGLNGSGKSTLLKLLAGFLTPSKGHVDWINQNDTISEEEQYLRLSVSAPYMQLIEELTLDEFLEFHSRFKSFLKNDDKESFKLKTGLSKQGDKQIKDFSSGMKQRVKLGLCFYFENDVILIDEGTTNLDAQGVAWFREEVQRLSDKLVILFSNQEEEYNLAQKSVELLR